MITDSQYKSMSRTLSLIVDCESSLRLIKERVTFGTNLSNDDLLIFINEEIVNTIDIIDKKIYDVLLTQRLDASNNSSPDEK